jgi:hypothetical protein
MVVTTAADCRLRILLCQKRLIVAPKMGSVFCTHVVFVVVNSKCSLSRASPNGAGCAETNRQTQERLKS